MHMTGFFRKKNPGAYFHRLPDKWHHQTAFSLALSYRCGAMRVKAPGHITCPGDTHSTAPHDNVVKTDLVILHCFRLPFFSFLVPMNASYNGFPSMSIGFIKILPSNFPTAPFSVHNTAASCRDNVCVGSQSAAPPARFPSPAAL